MIKRKAVLEIIKIKELRITFEVVLESTNSIPGKQEWLNTVVNKFKYTGTVYYKYTPAPYVLLEIKKKDDKEYNAGYRITMNRLNLHRFRPWLLSYTNVLKADHDRIYPPETYKEPEEYWQAQYIEEYKRGFTLDTMQREEIMFYPTFQKVGPEGAAIPVPSCAMCFRAYEFSTELTLEEMDLLYSYLIEINFTQLSMLLINASLLTDQKQSDESIEDNIRVIMKQEQPITTPYETKKYVPPTRISQIPNIL